MILYFFRLLWARRFSLGLTVMGMALALACGLASLRMLETLRAGHPVGTHFSGRPVSVMSYISTMRMSFVLEPAQILQLQEELGGTGWLVAAAGGRPVRAMLEAQEQTLILDIVSGNFFEVLGIRVPRADLSAWSGEEPVCLVSQSFIAKYGLQSPPTSLTLAGRSYRVLGVVEAFKGLFDAETEVWVPWQHGHAFLRSGLPDKGLLAQPPMYWAVAIPKPGADAAFAARLQGLNQRVDLLTPPVDAFKLMQGITYSDTLREDADASATLYVLSTAIMLAVATLNLACWSALTRAARLDTERLLLKLGVSRLVHLFYGASLQILPLLAATLLALPTSWLIQQVLEKDPSIALMLASGSTLSVPAQWGLTATLLALVASLGVGLGEWIARAAGVRFSFRATGFSGRVIRLTFRGLVALSAAACAVSLAFGVHATQAGWVAWTALAHADAEQTWFAFPDLESSAATTHSQSETLAKIAHVAKAKVPALSEVGMVAVVPLNSQAADQGFALVEGANPAVHAQVNAATPNVFSLLNLVLREGRGFDENARDEVVVDRRLASALASLSKTSSLLGQRIFDDSGKALKIVGVVDTLAYASAPDQRPLMAYKSLHGSRDPGYLVLRGRVSNLEINQLLSAIKLEAGLSYTNAQNHAAIITAAQVQYKSRALLCVLSAGVTMLIAAMSLWVVGALELRERRRSLATMSALGAGTLQLAWRACRGLLLTIAVGSAVGLLGLYAARGLLPWRMAVQADWWLVSCVTFAVLLVGALVGAGCLLARQFGRRPVAELLRHED